MFNGLAVQLIGFVGKDAEMRVTSTGTPVTNFSVAVSQPMGNGIYQTAWVRVAMWGKMAENAAKLVKKGQQIAVSGRMSFDPVTGGPRLYKNQAGYAATQFEATAYSFQLLGKREPKEGLLLAEVDETTGEILQSADVEANAPVEDEIPF